MTAEQAKVLRGVCDAVIGAVEAAGPLGCPAGTLYAALMTQGATLEQFENLMSGLVGIGKLRKSGNLYFVGAS